MHYASSVIIVTINFWRIRLLADDIHSWCDTEYSMRIGWRRRGLLRIHSCWVNWAWGDYFASRVGGFVLACQPPAGTGLARLVAGAL